MERANISCGGNRELLSYSHKSGWLLNTSEIIAGGSAILGGNRFVFFGIHHTALCTITVSFVASLIVICKIVSKWKHSMRKECKLDLSIRFPFYLAVAESLWGISHFSDHLYLVTTQRYPTERSVKLALSITLWFFFGYQQMMHASVAAFTYLRVVHRKNLNLGKYEWKLHLLWCSFLLLTILFFLFAGCFGNSGFWMMHDATSTWGMLLGVAMAATSTANAACTTLGYYCIRRTVLAVKAHLTSFNLTKAQSKPENSLASQCLATYVWMASCLYCPLALLLWVNILFQVFGGVVEPLSNWLIVIVANSSGWANAYAYFHNEALKRQKRETTLEKKAALLSIHSNEKSSHEYDNDNSNSITRASHV